MIQDLSHSPLGEKSNYSANYNPALLFAISRAAKRAEINIIKPPFTGYDIWNAYEVSWLNNKGKPIVATAVITVPCDSPNIFESKSAKLYLNSLNNTKFATIDRVRDIVAHDLSLVTGAEVGVELYRLYDYPAEISNAFAAIFLDELDIECDQYQTNSELLQVLEQEVSEAVYSDLLKSNCLITNQPDWGSVYIQYSGRKIDHSSLLRYIVSFRNHNEFHEQCVERIFQDIMTKCRPHKLTVYARYTRRGGLDINPLRTNCGVEIGNLRLVRQ